MKKGKVLGLMALSAVLLTGCVDSMPELTDEESAIVTEYAAGLILKYSPYYDYKLVSAEEVAAAKAAEQALLEAAEQQETDEQEETQTQPDEQEASGQPENQSGEPGQETPAEEVILSAEDMDFAAELGIDDLTLRYQSFELCDSYPRNSSGFRVNAAQGRKLLVVHFGLGTAAGENVDCNLFNYGMRMRMNINDTTSATALSTMLPDELMSYIDVIPAGGTADVVAVAEVNDMTEDEIASLTIQVSSNGGSCMAKLK